MVAKMAKKADKALHEFIAHEQTLKYAERMERHEDMVRQGLNPHDLAHRYEHHKSLSDIPEADFNDDEHIRGDDGKIYKRKVVQATAIAVGAHGPKTAFAAALETAMVKAAEDAHRDGVTNPDEIKKRVMAAKDKLESGNV